MGLWNGPSFGRANSQLEHYEHSIQEHTELLQHIKTGDARAARKTMEHHITRSMNNILKNFQTKN
jgi:DNA-binding GntR family transcriptional regulator